MRDKIIDAINCSINSLESRLNPSNIGNRSNGFDRYAILGVLRETLSINKGIEVEHLLRLYSNLEAITSAYADINMYLDELNEMIFDILITSEAEDSLIPM